LVSKATVADNLLEILNRLFEPGQPLVHKVSKNIVFELQQLLDLKAVKIQQITERIRVDFGEQIKQTTLNKKYFQKRIKKITKKKKRLTTKQAKSVTILAAEIDKADLRLNEIHRKVFHRLRVTIPPHLSKSGFRRYILHRRTELDKMMIEISRPKGIKRPRVIGIKLKASKKPSGNKKTMRKPPWLKRLRRGK